MDLIESISEREFGEIPDSIDEINGGLMNKTYRIKFDSESYILQIAETTEPHELENCLRSFQFFRNSDVSVPESYTADVREFEGSSYLLVEDLSGETLGDDFSSSEAFKAGKNLAYIHDFRSFEKAGWWNWEEREPIVQGFPGESLKTRIEQLMLERLDFFRDQGLGRLAEFTERFLENHLDKISDEFRPVFVHHDFNPGNLLFEDGQLVGVLDFDYAHASHSQRDLAKAANKFWLRGGKREDIYRGYRQVREIKDSFEKNKLLYRMESLLDEIAVMLRQNHITEEEALTYTDELERIESEIG